MTSYRPDPDDDDARAPPRRRHVDRPRRRSWSPRHPDECGKHCYPSARAATLALRQIGRRGPSLYPYRCRACAAWHLATRNDRTRRGIGWAHQKD